MNLLKLILVLASAVAVVSAVSEDLRDEDSAREKRTLFRKKYSYGYPESTYLSRLSNPRVVYPWYLGQQTYYPVDTRYTGLPHYSSRLYKRSVPEEEPQMEAEPRTQPEEEPEDLGQLPEGLLAEEEAGEPREKRHFNWGSSYSNWYGRRSYSPYHGRSYYYPRKYYYPRSYYYPSRNFYYNRWW